MTPSTQSVTWPRESPTIYRRFQQTCWRWRWLWKLTIQTLQTSRESRRVQPQRDLRVISPQNCSLWPKPPPSSGLKVWEIRRGCWTMEWLTTMSTTSTPCCSQRWQKHKHKHKYKCKYKTVWGCVRNTHCPGVRESGHSVCATLLSWWEPQLGRSVKVFLLFFEKYWFFCYMRNININFFNFVNF